MEPGRPPGRSVDVGHCCTSGGRGMSEGLATTFRLLSETDNDAAVRALIPALDSPHTAVQEGALRALLARRSPAGGRELLGRLPTFPGRWKEIVRRHPGRLTGAIRDALLGTDRPMCASACRAAVWFREYDLIPALLNLLEGRDSQNADLAGPTLLELAGQLYDELARPRDSTGRRDPQLVREHIVGSLEGSVGRFSRHGQRAPIEAFLLLVRRDNLTLQRILQDRHHASFPVTVDVLSRSSRPGVIRLLLSFLDDPRVPAAALSVVAKRSDPRFVRYLLRKIGREPSATVAQNLGRIDSIGWLRSGQAMLEQFDDTAQHAVVQLVIHSGVPRLEAFSTIEQLVLRGTPGGRRAAAEALGQFRGAAANNLALKALEDPDPQVQAAVVAQLRRRGIPGSLSRLVAMVDSPHAAVRRAARASLEEFTFQRFLRAFDLLDEEVQRSTGRLVKKIDLQTIPQLQAELRSRSRTRRLRGVAIARALGAVGRLEPLLIALLGDEDHLVRAQAADTLAHCPTEASRRALEHALGDRSATVQEAARASLAGQAQFRQWREAFCDPRD